MQNISASTIHIFSNKFADEYERAIDRFIATHSSDNKHFKWTVSDENLEQSMEDFFLTGFIEDSEGSNSKYVIVVFEDKKGFYERCSKVITEIPQRLADGNKEAP